MKYLSSCCQPVLTTIDGDDLRGEGRWERNVLAALLSEGRQVHTSMKHWYSSEPIPTNLIDEYREDWRDETISIVHGAPQCARIKYFGDKGKARAYIVHFFNGPLPGTEREVLEIHEQSPSSIVAATGYKSWTYLSSLKKSYGSSLVEFLPCPIVPTTIPGDSWKKPYLFWSCRNFPTYAKHPAAPLLFNKIYEFLNTDKDLQLKVYIFNVGYFLKDLEAASSYFFELPACRVLKPFKDRIELFLTLSWKQVMDIMSKTRLIVSPLEQYTANSSEAGMFGVPTLLPCYPNAWNDERGYPLFPELIQVVPGISGAFVNQLERLFIDHTYYIQHGNAYRNHVEVNHTYKAFINNIDRIAHERGWM